MKLLNLEIDSSPAKKGAWGELGQRGERAHVREGKEGGERRHERCFLRWGQLTVDIERLSAAGSAELGVRNYIGSCKIIDSDRPPFARISGSGFPWHCGTFPAGMAGADATRAPLLSNEPHHPLEKVQ